MKVFKAFIQRFEASQRSMNIKKLIFLCQELGQEGLSHTVIYLVHSLE